MPAINLLAAGIGLKLFTLVFATALGALFFSRILLVRQSNIPIIRGTQSQLKVTR